MSGRCAWVGANDALYAAYHDTEWGVPETDPRALWEKLVLDGFQAGLAWITILRKRETLRAGFAEFDPERVARFGPADIERLLADPGVIRSRAKIEAAIQSAQTFLRIEESGAGFAPFMWSFVGGAPIQNAWPTLADTPTQTPQSVALSKALKGEGVKFCGPVIVYAFMQAVGMVNDHETGCPRHREVAALNFAPPT